MYRHGWHGLSGLRYMLEDDTREVMYRDYTATMQRHLVQLCYSYFGGKDWSPPSYVDLAHPDEAAPAESKESKEDVKAHIYELFGAKPPEGR